MPACANESLSRLWSATPNGCLQRGSPPSPSSPGSISPPLRLDRSQSLGSLTRPSSSSVSGAPKQEPEPGLLARLIGWYPSFILRFTRNLIATVIYLAWSQFLFIVPTLWLSGCLWLFWKCFQPPLNILKWMLTFLYTPATERFRKKRTVLVSCGSTVQSVHLSRNLYMAGFRVVVFELEGLFGLARFSTAVERFYTVPKPEGDRAEAYISAIINIVEREKVSCYIPVSVTNSAYYDALVKPHLEIIGCTVFCPGLKEVCLLDDTYEVMKRCQSDGMATPHYYPVNNKEDISRLYEKGILQSGDHIMVNVGPLGCRDRTKLEVPRDRKLFRLTHSVSHQRPWLIVRDYPGDHFVTCTTVKESQVVANVICRVEPNGGGLLPVDHPQIDIWMHQFLGKLRFLRPLSGHLAFRFVESSPSGSIVPLGCRVGLSLPYICHTSVHPKIVCKPCRHFNSNSTGPLINKRGRYWMHELLIDTIKRPGIETFIRLIVTLLNKREVLFVYWDPLPYCAYYHLQLPLTNILRFLRGRPVHHGKVQHARFNRAYSVPMYQLPPGLTT
ncbi:uncharacterized protein LOC142334189 [Lycorma delicatula]|uniref:uncharacterized protein LOC142334189 n=1 Tax=Lycorma delicatula TaxID=130591 RepID=UPI003F5119D0